MNQKIKKLEKDIEQLGRKNDDMTLSSVWAKLLN